MLDAASDLNERDQSLATFVGSARVDRWRHPELAELLPDDRIQRSEFFTRLVDFGVANGEIDASQRDDVALFINIVLIGLSDVVGDDLVLQRAAIASIKSAIRGMLTPATS